MSKKVEVLFSIMKDGSKIPVSKMLKTLDVKQGSVMCLISALRNDFGAEIETERDGRKVISYKLLNADKVKIVSKAPKAAKATKAAKPAVKVAVTRTKTVEKKPVAVSDEIPTLDVEEVTSDAELAALKAELGLSDSYSE